MLLSKIQGVYVAGLKRYYKQRLAVDPAAMGSMQIRLSVEPTGRATDSQVTSFHPDHETCVKGLVPSWRFPVAKNAEGEPVLATFDLTFDHAAS